MCFPLPLANHTWKVMEEMMDSHVPAVCEQGLQQPVGPDNNRATLLFGLGTVEQRCSINVSGDVAKLLRQLCIHSSTRRDETGFKQFQLGSCTGTSKC